MSTTTTYTGIRIADFPDLGAFTDTSQVVGERAGSGLFNAPAVLDYITSSPVTRAIILSQAATGLFYQSDGATINRFNDRLFVGDATNNAGNAGGTDWLSLLVSWSVQTAQAAITSPQGTIALAVGSQTKDYATSGLGADADAIGLGAWAMHNVVSTDYLSAWALYGEARMYPGTTGATFGAEIEIMNVTGADSDQTTPYAQITNSSPMTGGIWLGSGGDAPVYGLTAYAASVGIGLINNGGGTFKTGLSFGATAIAGTNGNDSKQGEAIALAKGHVIRWYSPGGGNAATIYSERTGASPISLIFSDGDVSLWDGNTAVLGVETGSPAPGTTAMLLLVNNNSGLELANVALGPVDSGGAGTRALVVPN